MSKTKKPVRVLLIEDNPLYVRLIQEMLESARHTRFKLEETYRLSAGLARLLEGNIDVVLLDLSLPDSQGYNTFAEVRQRFPQLPLVVLTNIDSEDLAARTVYAGAQDYLVKTEMSPNLLVRVILYAIERQRMVTELVDHHTRRWESSESRFRTVVESTADGLIVIDKQGAVRFANPAAQALFAPRTDNLIGQLFGFPVVIGETTELDLIQTTGDITIVEMRISKTEWDGEQVYLASLRDITQRKQAEAANRTYARQQAELARLSHQALSEVDLGAMLELAVQIVAETCEVEYCQILELQTGNGKLQIRAGVGWPEGYAYPAEMGPSSLSLAGYTLRVNEPVITENLVVENRFSEPSLHPLGIISAMSTVVQGHNRPFGVLCAYSVKNRNFTEKDVNFLQAVANVLAAAIERLRVEEELRASVKEKEVLLREVHHRVKNNLQAISNLLYLQANYINDGRITEIFREMRDRIKSIALIHERLYETNDLAQINFAEYVQRLTDQLIHSYGAEGDHIKLEIAIAELPVNVDMAIPLGVIINELVSNSLKHAFPPELGRPPDEPNFIRIELSVQPDQSLLLTVSDNGVGFPLETDLATSKTLGLHLVQTLSSHVGGEIQLGQGSGATIRIRFKPAGWLEVQPNV